MALLWTAFCFGFLRLLLFPYRGASLLVEAVVAEAGPLPGPSQGALRLFWGSFFGERTNGAFPRVSPANERPRMLREEGS